jgi:hypothetical protein
MESTNPRPYAGPERRQSNRVLPPPQVVGRARLRRGLLSYPGFRPGTWYAVFARNARILSSAEDGTPLPGYIWVDGPTRAEHVWAAHFEVQLYPEEAPPR